MQAAPIPFVPAKFQLGHYILVALGLLVVCIGVGIATYFVSNQQAPVYEATAKILADSSATLPNGLTTGILYNTTNLDSVAYREASLSQEVIQGTFVNLGIDIRIDDVSGFRDRASITISKGARAITDVYVLRYRSLDPNQASKYLNAWAQALLQWDRDFARHKMDKYIHGLEAQYKSLLIAGQQLNSTLATEEERAYFRQIRGNVFKDIQLFKGLRNSVQGTLQIIEKAVPPSIPIAPRPKRNAAIASFISFAVLSGLVLLYLAWVGNRQNPQAFEINI